MEVPQEKCDTCEGVQLVPTKQNRAHPPSWFTTSLTYSQAEMGEHFYGLHYRAAQGPRQRLLVHSSGQID